MAWRLAVFADDEGALPHWVSYVAGVFLTLAHECGMPLTGARIVEVETRDQLESAVGPNTAMMLFFNDADPRGAIKVEEFAALGKKHNVVTMNDCVCLMLFPAASPATTASVCAPSARSVVAIGSG